MEQSDKLLRAVIAYGNGNPDAFNIIYEESNKYIYTCIYKVVKGNDNVQDIICDVMQDTYVQISKSIDQLEHANKFLSWAGMIATRMCYHYLKKSNKYVLLNEDDNTFENLSDDDEIIPEEVMQSREKQRLLREIIETQLTEMQKICIIAYYYNEQKQSEIAQSLGIPENTVKTNLLRAKAKIKEGVLDLEKNKGTRLYSATPLLLLLFKEDVKAAVVPAKVSANIQKSIAGASAMHAGGTVSAVSKTGLWGKIAAASVKTKLIAAITTVGITSAAGGVGYMVTQQFSQFEEVSENVDEDHWDTENMNEEDLDQTESEDMNEEDSDQTESEDLNEDDSDQTEPEDMNEEELEPTEPEDMNEEDSDQTEPENTNEEDLEPTENATATIKNILMSPENFGGYYPERYSKEGLLFAVTDLNYDGVKEVFIGDDVSNFKDVPQRIFNILYEKDGAVYDVNGDNVYDDYLIAGFSVYENGIIKNGGAGFTTTNLWNMYTGESWQSDGSDGLLESLCEGQEIQLEWHLVSEENIQTYIYGSGMSLPSGNYKANNKVELDFVNGVVFVREGNSSTMCEFTVDETGKLTIIARAEVLEGTYDPNQDIIYLYGVEYELEK